jgi:hypothetical protein
MYIAALVPCVFGEGVFKKVVTSFVAFPYYLTCDAASAATL